MGVVIFPPTIDWDWMMQRHQHLALQFALHGHEVFYLNQTQQQDTMFSVPAKNLTLIHNHRYFHEKISPTFRLSKQKVLVWSFWPSHAKTLDIYKPDYVIFDYIDDFPQWNRFLPLMVSKANSIITSSLALRKKLKNQFPNRQCFLIPNGCDLASFQSPYNVAPRKPKELKGHTGPIITYIGALAPWVDQELIRQLANNLHGALILLIGARFGASFKTMPPNVKYLGHRTYSTLPAYLFFSDVCLIPFKLNKITMATNPVKLYEYLAAGKPIVSTDLPEVAVAPYVFIGKDANSFIEQIKRVLAPSFKINRSLIDEWLSDNSWTKRYSDIEKILKDQLPFYK